MENQQKFTAIIIIGGIAIFAVGVYLGTMYGISKTPAQKKVEVINKLYSKVITSVVAYGEVKNINGKDLTLNNLGEDLVISVADSAQIYSFIATPAKKGESPVQQLIKFSDIKKGDKVNATVRLSSDGKLEGLSVIVLPASAK
ncbi:MAG: hypothetical protein NTV36_00360 [Candidatus Staskawiczbacteria bacterium]|nr:hypothetical protein [Candidatus Staskawiczbacteria bacterium]